MAAEKLPEQITDQPDANADQNAPQATPGSAEQDDAQELQQSSPQSYFLNKNRHLEVVCAPTKDLVSGEYKLITSEPLPQFSTKLAKAYAVEHKFTKNKENFYAVVLDNRYPFRLAEINKLRGQAIESLANVQAAEKIPTSLGVGHSFVVVVERPKGISLRQYVESNGPLSELIVTDHLVPSLNSCLEFFENQEIVHGRINPDNIYIEAGGKIVLGEGISEPSGLSQPMLYEHVDRAVALPLGKGTGDRTTDFYAMGVLVTFALSGYDPSLNFSEEELLALKYMPNTYHLVTKNADISPQVLDLLRGVINDKKHEIWQSGQIHEWCGGRRFNLLAPHSNKEASRPITFVGRKFQSKKQLAQTMYENWEEAKEFCREDTLARWVERSIQDSELAERLETAAHVVVGDLTSRFNRDDELLAHVLLLLDPYGPIRVPGLVANLDGVGPLLAHAFATDDEAVRTGIVDVLGHNLISLWGDLSSTNPTRSAASYQEVVFSLEKSEDLYKKKDMGFGLERCLYEQNPTLPCQSPYVEGDCLFTIAELLRNLEINEQIGQEIIDQQMAAFMANRIELPRKIRIPKLAQFPDFFENQYVQKLSMLAFAQQTGDVQLVPGLCNKVLESLRTVIDAFQNIAIKEELQKGLVKASRQGSMINMLAAISDPKYLVRDRVGFNRAAKRYKHNAIQVLKLSNRKTITNIGYRYGLQLSVMLTFIVATIVFVIYTMKSF